MRLTLGDTYPAFNLVDHGGDAFDSGALDGVWFLLYWYPKADTPGCTAQAIGIRDQLEVFNDLGCVVLGASLDSPEVNASFRSKYRLPFRLLSDVARTLAMEVGAVTDSDTEYASRIAHLVSPSGVVVREYEVEDPEFFAETVLDDLEDLQE